MGIQFLDGKSGDRYRLAVVLDHRGRSIVGDLLFDRSTSVERPRFMAFIERMAERGPEETPACEPAQGLPSTWYAHASKHLRLWVLRDGDVLVLVHAAWKTQRKMDPADAKRAGEAVAEYRQNRRT